MTGTKTPTRRRWRRFASGFGLQSSLRIGAVVNTLAQRYHRARMPEQPETLTLQATPFLLGDWLVEPTLNRLTRGDETVQLELKAMDVLLCLTAAEGRLVSKRELIDTVWQTEFVADNTLTRRIADLRQVLGDDARAPRYIETISRRGYRVVALIADAEDAATVTPFPVSDPEEETGPYPGLAPFTEADAEFFFGRGYETTALWRKIVNRRLLAVAGPSGTGKSSFIRAGVMAVAPAEWGMLIFHPGEAPFASLARALAPAFVDDVEAIRHLVGTHDPDAALAVVSRWRDRTQQALLVVDQFEELFTLNPVAVQAEFADLLLRVASAADVHVVIVLRDDFLHECQDQPALRAVLKDLTMLGSLDEAGLKRAILTPAEKSGYHFGDEMLADEMLAEVAGERGALPLVAFAVRQLWDRRDRQRSLLTREAYEETGGVSGALVQHAETTLEAIGAFHRPMVREVFRNLVTAQSTRAVRDIEELLSVFEPDQRPDAQTVLQALIDARLLTAYESEGDRDAETNPQRRVEIIHESLLTSWPRLVRWQTQDADAAQLRDQLRQAARVWHARGRSEDLLWQGTSYRELALWLENYPGGLSKTEDAFVRAARGTSARRRRWRRLAFVASLVIVLSVSVVMTILWTQGVRETRRAEARLLFLRGRVNLDYYPAGSFSSAVESLELQDDPEVRSFAFEALQRVPMPAQILWTESDPPIGVDFSPDGRWLAMGYYDGTVRLWSASGGEPVVVVQALPAPVMVRFAPDSRSFAAIGVAVAAFRFFAIPDGRPLTDLEPGGWRGLEDTGDATGYGNLRRLLRVVPKAGADGWTVDWSGFERHSGFDPGLAGPAALDSTGARLAFARNGELLVADGAGLPRTIARHQRQFEQMVFHPNGEILATIDSTGEVQFWSLNGSRGGPVQTLRGERESMFWDLEFNPTGTLLVATQESGKVWIWAVDGPPDAAPLAYGSWAATHDAAFDPSGRWLARASGTGGSVQPIDLRRFGYVLRGHTGPVKWLDFLPDSEWLVSSSVDGDVRLWPIEPTTPERGGVLCRLEQPLALFARCAVAPDASFVALPTAHGSVRLQGADGELLQELKGFAGRVIPVAVSPGGGLVAASGGLVIRADRLIRVWNLEEEGVVVLDDGEGGMATSLGFVSDDVLLAVTGGGLYRWTLSDRRRELLLEDVTHFAQSSNHRSMVLLHSDLSASFYDLATGATTKLTNHGANLQAIALAPDGRTVVTGNDERIVRVGPVEGDGVHLLFGHKGMVSAVAVSSDGRWVASGSRDGAVRLWPMPEGRPIHTLPREDLLERLRALRSYRSVPSDTSPTGFYDVPVPFKGWKHAPPVW